MWILSAHAVYASISCTMNGRVQQPLLVQAKAGGLQQTLAACQRGAAEQPGYCSSIAGAQSSTLSMGISGRVVVWIG